MWFKKGSYVCDLIKQNVGPGLTSFQYGSKDDRPTKVSRNPVDILDANQTFITKFCSIICNMGKQ